MAFLQLSGFILFCNSVQIRNIKLQIITIGDSVQVGNAESKLISSGDSVQIGNIEFQIIPICHPV